MDIAWLHSDFSRHQTLAQSWVTPEPSRCVQCGICSFHCPMGIDVRLWVWRHSPVRDSRCLTCGECVERCPRGLLRFEAIAGDEEPSGSVVGVSAGPAGPDTGS